MKATFDTNILIHDREIGNDKLADLVKKHSIDVCTVSVTDREFKGDTNNTNKIPETTVWDESPWGVGLWGGKKIPETLVLGESKLGESLVGQETDGSVFEGALTTISSGSFPPSGKRDNLTDAQRRQLRDAMIFAAHVREGRDIFVTNDRKGFIGRDGSNRRVLESRFRTRIMTYDEFVSHLETEGGKAKA